MDYKIIKRNGVKYIYVPDLFELGLNHCYTTADFNMRIGSESRKNGSLSNYYRAFRDFDINTNDIYFSNQFHTDNVSVVDIEKNFKKFVIGKQIPNSDGLISSRKNTLITNYADCCPIILFDKREKVVANIHSGWRGTFKQIVQKSIIHMKKSFNSDPKNIIAVLGPSISFDDFEVHEDVANMFISKFYDLDNIVKKKNKNKYLIDLDAINIHSLTSIGVKLNNILNIDISTVSNPELLHSYRRDPDNYSLMALITNIK